MISASGFCFANGAFAAYINGALPGTLVVNTYSVYKDGMAYIYSGSTGNNFYGTSPTQVLLSAKDGAGFQARTNLRIIGSGQLNVSNGSSVYLGTYFNAGDLSNGTTGNQPANQLSMNVLSGSTWTSNGISLGRGTNDRVTANFDGPGTVVTSGATNVGYNGQALLTVSNGAKFDSTDLMQVGALGVDAWDGTRSTLIVKDSGTVVNAKDISVGGIVTIGSGTEVNVKNALTIKDENSVVTVSNYDGQQSLNTQKVLFSGPGTLAFDTAGPLESSFSSSIEGQGNINKSGDGVTRLTGDTTKFTGVLNVEQGGVVVDQAFGASSSTVNVKEGGVLSGAGDILGQLSLEGGGKYDGVGNLLGGLKIYSNGIYYGKGFVSGEMNVEDGAIASPSGESVGTVRVSGNLTFKDNSIYAVSAAANGESDLIDVSPDANRSGTGKTVIGNNVNIEATAIDPQKDYRETQVYTVLKSANGIEGNFSKVVPQNAFLTGYIDRHDTYINLGLKVADPGVFQAAAQTKNEYAVAGALHGLGSSTDELALFNKVLALGDNLTQARSAFDALSGELYASAKAVLIKNEFSVGQAVNQQLLSDSYKDGEKRPAKSVWVQPYNNNSRFVSDLGASDLTNNSDGVLAGADIPVFDNARVGVMFGAGHSKSEVSSLSSKNETDDYNFGVYGAKDIGQFSVRGGVIMGRHEINAKRNVEFSDFSSRVSSKYNAKTIQTYAEADYKIAVGNALVKPFVNVSRVDMETSGFKEKGDVAALAVKKDTVAVNMSTAGVRSSLPFKVKNTDASLYADVGWQHVFGDIEPDATMSIASTPNYTVSGVRLSRDAAVVGLGANVKLLKNVSLGVGYSGNFGSQNQSNGVDATLKMVF